MSTIHHAVSFMFQHPSARPPSSPQPRTRTTPRRLRCSGWTLWSSCASHSYRCEGRLVVVGNRVGTEWVGGGAGLGRKLPLQQQPIALHATKTFQSSAELRQCCCTAELGCAGAQEKCDEAAAQLGTSGPGVSAVSVAVLSYCTA